MAKLKVIYEPKGAALEYASLACNLMLGCTGGCRYCYGPGTTHSTRENWCKPKPRAGILDALARDADMIQERCEGYPETVFLSFLCDPFSQECIDTTRAAIHILHERDIRIRTLTKRPSFAMENTGKDIAECGVDFGVSLVWSRDCDREVWEPHTEGVEQRFNALADAHGGCGVKTWLSIEPVIDPSQVLTVIRECGPYADMLRIGSWNHDARAKAIGYAQFLRDALPLLQGHGYYIKNDLWKHADAETRANYAKENGNG